MKQIRNLFSALVIMMSITLIFTSCDSKEGCDCKAYSIETSAAAKGSDGKVQFCHNGKTIEVSTDNTEHGKTHADGTECYPGTCGTLGVGDIVVVDYSNNCNDDGNQVNIDNKQYVISCTEGSE